MKLFIYLFDAQFVCLIRSSDFILRFPTSSQHPDIVQIFANDANIYPAGIEPATHKSQYLCARPPRHRGHQNR